MSKYATTEYNRQMRLASRLRDIHSQIRFGTLPFSAYLKLKKQWTESSDYRRAPMPTICYLQGMGDILFDLLQNEQMDWIHVLRGKVTDSNQIHGMDWQKLKSVSVWKGTLFAWGDTMKTWTGECPIESPIQIRSNAI